MKKNFLVKYLSILLATVMITSSLTGLSRTVDVAAAETEPTIGARSKTSGSSVFLGGNYIEVGVSGHGSFGTADTIADTKKDGQQEWHCFRTASSSFRSVSIV